MLLVVAAIAIAALLKAGPVVGRMLALSREARSQWPTLNDDGREALSRRMAAGMGALCLRITAILIAALGAPLLALWLLDRARLVAFDKVIATSLSPGFLVATTLTGVVLAWIVAHRPAPAVDGWRHRYSRVERLLHVLAFATWPLQVALADIEVVVFARELRGLETKRPVFVAGLPRAGTTLLLQLLEATGEFASYRYRDMPFLLAPMFWRALSPRNRDLVAPQARARRWRRDRNREPRGLRGGPVAHLSSGAVSERHPAVVGSAGRSRFPEAFRSQMRKLIAIRRTDAPNATRYLSKNNGNIARLAAVAAMFPDAVVLAPTVIRWPTPPHCCVSISTSWSCMDVTIFHAATWRRSGTTTLAPI
uniref:Sulfotransferase n=1 Tax=Phenylobacterium glaciei TaxID=2803784 RepID=A0A974P5U8_9CAUL|nr:sulfotransferase [Phenylobacterium glaciei]